jgi:hypothetical protein
MTGKRETDIDDVEEREEVASTDDRKQLLRIEPGGYPARDQGPRTVALALRSLSPRSYITLRAQLA